MIIKYSFLLPLMIFSFTSVCVNSILKVLNRSRGVPIRIGLDKSVVGLEISVDALQV